MKPVSIESVPIALPKPFTPLNIKFRALENNVRNGLKPFRMKPYNSDGLYARQKQRWNAQRI
ncbi:MAG: hypothetical protein F9K23_02725 [Bacteroidetes bacterium]|nr:MAG: hypothetical protein F9K23_02725 [Bacteroidota bacterium]